MDDGAESRWATVEDGTVVWFPHEDSAAKGAEYIPGKVVEDNGDKVFIETHDGTTYNVSKKNIAAYKRK